MTLCIKLFFNKKNDTLRYVHSFLFLYTKTRPFFVMILYCKSRTLCVTLMEFLFLYSKSKTLFVMFLNRKSKEVTKNETLFVIF